MQLSEPRYYQLEARDAAFAKLRQHRATMVVMATGSGKTRLAQIVVQQGIAAGRRMMFLADRNELIDQACAAMDMAVPGMVGKEKASSRASRYNHPCVVACDASLSGGRLLDYPPDSIDLIISDECHLDLSKRRMAIFGHFPSAKIIGLTATPYRGDGISLGNLYDGGAAYTYSLHKGIKDGYLVPINNIEIEVTSVDFDEVKRRNNDFDEESMSDAMTTMAAIDDLAIPILKECGERKTVIFCSDIRHAQRLSERLNAHKRGCCEAVWGTNRNRRKILQAHQAGMFQFLTNPDMLTKGYDDGDISAVVIGSPTYSYTTFVQRAGRGARLATGARNIDESRSKGKKDCLLLTVKGKSRGRLICHEDMLAGRMLTDDELAAVKGLQREGMDSMAATRPEVFEVIVAKNIEKAQKSAAIAANVEYIARAINPFIDPPVILSERIEGAVATDGQIRKLKRIGAELPNGEVSAEIAAAIIERAEERTRTGLCTLKMARWLSAQQKVCEVLGIEDPARCDAETARNAFNIVTGIEPWPRKNPSESNDSQRIASLEIASSS